MMVVRWRQSGIVNLVVSTSSLSIDGASARRRSVIAASDTVAITLVAQLFPDVSDLAELRHIELDQGLMSASYSSQSTATPA